MIIHSDDLKAALKESLWSADYHGDLNDKQVAVWEALLKALERNEYCCIAFRAPCVSPATIPEPD